MDKPKKRSQIRRAIGREYFILRRKFSDLKKDTQWADELSSNTLPSLIKAHRTITMRPLKKVDMHLQKNKVTNLSIALKHLDGILLKPGQEFSFWRLVGRPTKARGYLDGLVLNNGSVTKGIGGGLCQLGNMLYWLFLHRSLEVTERWRHSYDVFPDVNRTQPFGCGATLAYNYIDLRARNNTNKTYQLRVTLDERHLLGELRATEPETCTFAIFESDHHFKKEWWGGFTRHNKIWKRRTDKSSQKTENTLVTENHAIMMYNPLIEYEAEKMGVHCE